MESLKMMWIAAFTLALLGPVVAAEALPAGAAAAGAETSKVLASYPLTTLDGKTVKLSSFRGEVVVVNFWASWCAPCLKELPMMNDWHAAWAGRGARVVAISIDKEMQNAQRFAKKANLSLTVLHDGPTGLIKTLDLPSLPCTYVLDRKGNVVTMIRSSSEKDLAALQKKVESLLKSPRSAPTQKAGMEAPSMDAATGTSTDGETP